MLYPRCLFIHKTEDCSKVDFLSFNEASGSERTLADAITLTDRKTIFTDVMTYKTQDKAIYVLKT